MALSSACSSDTADLYDRVEHHYADSDGVRIHYVTVGQGPLVVMIHGFPDYWYTWRHQMEALSADHRVAAPAPPASSVGTVLRILNLTTGEFDLISHTSIQDIKPMESTTTTTYEIGYKGVIGERFLVAADIYYSRIKNIIGDERLVTPNVFLDSATLGVYL